MTISTPTMKRPTRAAHKFGTLSPHEQGILWDMEEQFWTSGADNGRETTTINAVMVLP